MLRRATHRETIVAMQRNLSILNKIRTILKPLGYRFQDKVIGSKKFNTILVDNGNPYDIDVRLILTHNTKVINEEKIFIDFKNAFEQIKNTNLNIFYGSQSIKCLVYNKDNLLYSIEYVIMRDNCILRLNKNQNKHTWHQLKASYENIYNLFDGLPSNIKEHIILDYILPLKINARNRNDDKSSIALFIEGYNNYIGEAK